MTTLPLSLPLASHTCCYSIPQTDELLIYKVQKKCTLLSVNDSDIIFYWSCVLHALICLASRNWFIQMCIKLSHLWTLQYYFMFLPLPLHFCCTSLCFIHGQNQQQSWSQHKCIAYSFTCNWIFFLLLVSPFYAWPAFMKEHQRSGFAFSFDKYPWNLLWLSKSTHLFIFFNPHTSVGRVEFSDK